MVDLVSLEEVNEVLNGFCKDKSIRLYSWFVYFFLSFFDMVGQDLVDVVNESRVSGKVVGSLNATFITYIPKGDVEVSFNNYRAISLCNVVYKIISKIIDKRLKLMMTKWMM